MAQIRGPVEYKFCATARPKFSMQFLFFLSNNIWAKRVVLVLRSILLSRNIEIIYNRIILGELDAILWKMLVKWFFKENIPSSELTIFSVLKASQLLVDDTVFSHDMNWTHSSWFTNNLCNNSTRQHDRCICRWKKKTKRVLFFHWVANHRHAPRQPVNHLHPCSNMHLTMWLNQNLLPQQESSCERNKQKIGEGSARAHTHKLK